MPANLGMRKLLREERRFVSKVVVGKSKLRRVTSGKKRWGSRALSPTFFTVQCTNLGSNPRNNDALPSHAHNTDLPNCLKRQQRCRSAAKQLHIQPRTRPSFLLTTDSLTLFRSELRLCHQLFVSVRQAHSKPTGRLG